MFSFAARQLIVWLIKPRRCFQTTLSLDHESHEFGKIRIKHMIFSWTKFSFFSVLHWCIMSFSVFRFLLGHVSYLFANFKFNGECKTKEIIINNDKPKFTSTKSVTIFCFFLQKNSCGVNLFSFFFRLETVNHEKPQPLLFYTWEFLFLSMIF